MKSIIAVLVFLVLSTGYAEEESISLEKRESFRKMLYPDETKEESLVEGIEFIEKQIDKTDESKKELRMYLFQRKELAETELKIHRQEKLLIKLNEKKAALEKAIQGYHEKNIEE